MSFIRFFELVEGSFRAYNSYQETKSQRDLISELSYLQEALCKERDLVFDLRESLQAKARESDTYYAILKMEGYILDANGGLIRVEVEEDEPEEEVKPVRRKAK